MPLSLLSGKHSPGHYDFLPFDGPWPMICESSPHLDMHLGGTGGVLAIHAGHFFAAPLPGTMGRTIQQECVDTVE